MAVVACGGADAQDPQVRGCRRRPSHREGEKAEEGLVSPTSARHAGIRRNSSSYALLLRLEAAGPEWRGVQGVSEAGGSSRKASLKGGDASEACPPAARPGPAEQLCRPSQHRREEQHDQFVKSAELRDAPSFPRILCVTRRHMRKHKYVDIFGEFHLDLIQKFGGAPIIIPRTTKTIEQLAEYLPMDGLVIAEGNDLSDDILLKYGCSLPERLSEEAAKEYAGDTELDVSKDVLEFNLLRFALATGVPILTFCRGSQMLSCLRGGSLIGDIATQTGSKIQHLRDCDAADYDSFRHPIEVKPNTPIAEWFADSLPNGATELLVNSYHHQACKDLGSDLVPMAHAPDGIIEAFYDPSYSPAEGQFVVGLQFHPERMLEDYPGCERCYESFLQASHAYKAAQDASV
mmetsp:Transcript_57111/g.124225  ORF Transcript_57111/g.124225 Transcript_57111/m.124225 type:complete len:404 (-) Transcript_57111:75-1286(-)